MNQKFFVTALTAASLGLGLGCSSMKNDVAKANGNGRNDWPNNYERWVLILALAVNSDELVDGLDCGGVAGERTQRGIRCPAGAVA